MNVKTTLLLFLLFSQFIIIGCNKTLPESAQQKLESLEKTPSQTDTVSATELRTRPDIILNAYKDAYPHLISRVFFENDDWALEMHNGKIFLWTNGRFLPPEKKADWQKFRSYQIYAYRGTPRDPEKYSTERIEALRAMGETRSVPQLPQENSFLDALLETKTRASTEQHIKKTTLFGKQVTVHELLIPKLQLIDEKVLQEAKIDSKIASFIEDLSEVGGYSWRNVEGTNRSSNHSYGIAIDILPKNRQNKIMYWAWEKQYNKNWMLVPQNKLWTPPEKVVAIFQSYGFIWGGTWDIYDTMHFEYRPELVELNKKIVF